MRKLTSFKKIIPLPLNEDEIKRLKKAQQKSGIGKKKNKSYREILMDGVSINGG